MKKGNLIHVNPGTLSWNIVTIIFTEPRSEEVIKKSIPTSQNVCPGPDYNVAKGTYDVQPECAGN